MERREQDEQGQVFEIFFPFFYCTQKKRTDSSERAEENNEVALYTWFFLMETSIGAESHA